MVAASSEVRAYAPSVGPVLLVVFLDVLSIGLIGPYLAEIARDSFGTGAFGGTLLGTVYALMQFAFAPVWGRISDRVGRRPVLVVSIACTVVGMLWLGAAMQQRHAVWIFAARIFSGIATANVGTATAYVADVSTPAERARAMGLMGAAYVLGLVVGPVLGAPLSQIRVAGHQGPAACFVGAGLSAINLAWVLAQFRESRAPDAGRATSRVGLWRVIGASPGVAQALAINFLGATALSAALATSRYFHKDVFGLGRGATGAVLALAAFASAIVQGGLVGVLSRRASDAALVRGGVLVQGYACVGFVASASLGVAALVASSTLLALGNALLAPATSAFISKRVDPDHVGIAVGTNTAVVSLSGAVGPALGGYLYGRPTPTMPFLCAAAILLVAFGLALSLRDARES